MFILLFHGVFTQGPQSLTRCSSIQHRTIANMSDMHSIGEFQKTKMLYYSSKIEVLASILTLIIAIGSDTIRS